MPYVGFALLMSIKHQLWSVDHFTSCCTVFIFVNYSSKRTVDSKCRDNTDMQYMVNILVYDNIPFILEYFHDQQGSAKV